MTFAYAFTQMGEDDDDRFRLYFSDDCGETWTLIRQWRGTVDLPTVNTSDSYFTPASGDWDIASIEITNEQYFNSDFRYKFYFDSDNGNNMYVDRVQFSNLTSVPETSGVRFGLSPQPADVDCLLTFDAITQNSVLTVYDLNGKMVMQENLAAGITQTRLSTAQLDNGFYLVNIDTGKKVLSTKLAVIH
jgi:hypothetical protein